MTLSTKIGIFEKGEKDIFNVEYSNKRLLRCDERELEDYDVEDGTEVICDRAFSGKDRLVNIFLPDSVKAIGESAFSGCRKLKGINIPEGVKEIKSYTFRDCDSLEELSLPESINKIEMGALGKGLKVLTIISPDAEIHRHAFLNCKDLDKLIVPEGSGKYYRTILATARIPAEVEEKNFEEDLYNKKNLEDTTAIMENHNNVEERKKIVKDGWEKSIELARKTATAAIPLHKIDDGYMPKDTIKSEASFFLFSDGEGEWRAMYDKEWDEVEEFIENHPELVDTYYSDLPFGELLIWNDDFYEKYSQCTWDAGCDLEYGLVHYINQEADSEYLGPAVPISLIYNGEEIREAYPGTQDVDDWLDEQNGEEDEDWEENDEDFEED